MLSIGIGGVAFQSACSLKSANPIKSASLFAIVQKAACKKGGSFEPPSLNSLFGFDNPLLLDVVLRPDCAYLFLPPDTATLPERALVTNRLRLTPSFSARSTRAWCKDFGKRTVNLPLNFV